MYISIHTYIWYLTYIDTNILSKVMIQHRAKDIAFIVLCLEIEIALYVEYKKESFHFTSIISIMYFFSDYLSKYSKIFANKCLIIIISFLISCHLLVFACLFVSGFHFGYYCKYTYIYRSLWFNWYVLFGVLLGFILAAVWTLRKYMKKKYLFENFYIIFYGLICSIISAVFLATENTGKLTDYSEIRCYYIIL